MSAQRGGRALAYALMLGVVALGVAWWLMTFRLVEVDVPLPPKGPAARHEFYGLSLALKAMDRDVVLAKRMDEVAPLDPADALLLQGEASILRDVDVDAIVRFVESGGHLIYAPPPYGDDDALAAALGLAREETWELLEYRSASGKQGSFSGRGLSLAVGEGEEMPIDLELGDADPKDGAAVLRYARGEGQVLAMSSLHAFSNYGLNPLDRDYLADETEVLDTDDAADEPSETGADDANIEFGWQLLAPMIEGRRVVLLDAVPVVMDPLWKILFRDGWPVVVPLLLALLAWIALRSMRIGPFVQALGTDRRSLIEHVQAAGEFAFRRGRALALHAAAKRAFKARLARTDPVLAALEDDLLAETLAQRHGVPVGDVRHALNPVDVARPAAFLATIKTLMELRAKP